MVNKTKIKIEIAYGSGSQDKLVLCEVPINTNIKQAIILSGMLTIFPELKPDLDANKLKVGIFSKRVKLEDGLKNNDRVEIYRELVIDPKEARRLRAKKS